jgi:hypothetical protein
LINWVSKAWEDIDESIVIVVFLRCGISNNVDGSDEDLVGKDVPAFAASEDVISGADMEENIFASDSEADDDFVGWGEDGESMYESD